MGIIESAAYGCPSIAFDSYSALADLVQDGTTGFTVPAFNDKIFVQKLKLLMGNEKLRCQMGEGAHKLIQRFRIDKIASQWIRLFEEVLTSR